MAAWPDALRGSAAEQQPGRVSLAGSHHIVLAALQEIFVDAHPCSLAAIIRFVLAR